MAVDVGAEGWVNGKIIRLTSDETRPVLMNKQVCKKANKGLDLIGKFVGSTKKINVQAMKEHFQRLWCQPDSNDDLKVIVMVEEEEEEEANMFLFKFPNREVLEKVVAYSSGGPWSFDDQLLLLADLDITSSSKTTISFNDLHVWIQINGLPLHLLHEDVGTLIGASIGEQVHRVEVHIEDRCIRVRTRIKTYKPLRRCARVQIEDDEEGSKNLWVVLVYEGIPKVCQWCGRVDHQSSACAVRTGPPGYDGERLLLPPKQGGQKRKQKEEMMNPAGRKKQAKKGGRRRQAVVGIKIKLFTEDIIIEIMRRLSVKSLIRFMCVCKTWYNLISSPEIVFKHNRKVSLFFQKCSSGNESSSTNLLFRFSGLPMNLTIPLASEEVKINCCEGYEVKIIGCCEGVVCLSLSHVFALWNPATTQFRIIRKQCFFDSTWIHLSNCGFCFDPVSNSFKVVYVPLQENGTSELKVNILTTTARTHNYSWREANTLLPCQILSIHYRSGVCMGRYMYWVVTSTDFFFYVLCFDMVDEAFNRIDAPSTSPYNFYEFHLSCYKNEDTIALISHGWYNDSVVYTLNDCRQSWTHVRTIAKPHAGDSSKSGFFIMDGVDWLVFRESHNDRVWMIDEETNETSKLFPWKGYGVYEFYQYKESLVSF